MSVTAIVAIVIGSVFGLGIGTAVFLRKRSRNRQKEDIRISVAELNRKIHQNHPPVVVDLRHPLDVLASPQMIPGAIPIKPDELDKHLANLPRNSEIVLYCTCPSEETSLSVYRQLQKRGFQRLKVLTGGLPAWKQEKLQLQDLYPEVEQQLRKQAAEA
jgi:rhodanese-related sulfurtransferase